MYNGWENGDGIEQLFQDAPGSLHSVATHGSHNRLFALNKGIY